MKLCRLLPLVLLLVSIQFARAKDAAPAYPPLAEVKAKLLAQLDRPRVPLDPQVSLVEPSEPGLVVERLTIASEKKPSGSIERVPILIIRPEDTAKPKPLVIVLHGTGGNKEGQKQWLARVARLGMIGLAIDARYHGRGPAGPGGLGLCGRDHQSLADEGRGAAGTSLLFRHGVGPVAGAGLCRHAARRRSEADRDDGVSMGGIETWLAAAVDERVERGHPLLSACKAFAGAWGTIAGKVGRARFRAPTTRPPATWASRK